MLPFNLQISHLGEDINLDIKSYEGFYQISHNGNAIGLLKQTGSDWELLPGPPVTTSSFDGWGEHEIQLGMTEINFISAAIEQQNHLSG